VCHSGARADAEQPVALLAFQFTLAASKFEDIVSPLHVIVRAPHYVTLR